MSGADASAGSAAGSSRSPVTTTWRIRSGQFLTQFYGEQADQAESVSVDDGHTKTDPVPREVLVPALPPDVDEVRDWLSGLRGSHVDLRIPQRGDKKALMETVHRNAADALAHHKLKRAGDLTTRSAALTEIQDTLGLDSAPLRIECIDISHVQGTDVVASLVVFEDGLPRKSDYRHYAIKEAAGEGHSDDVASIAEVTRRRFLRHRVDVADGRPTAPAEVTDGASRAVMGETSPPRRRSIRRPGVRDGSPTHPTCSSSTVVPRRCMRPQPCSTSSTSPTWPSWAWPNASRRCGCPATTIR